MENLSSCHLRTVVVANGRQSTADTKICQRACSFKDPCPADYRCSLLNELEVGICTKICVPGEAGECPEGSACFDIDGDGTNECYQAQFASFDRGIGQVCAARDQCRAGLVCSNFDPVSERGLCTQVCRSSEMCGEGAHCNGLSETVLEGVCQKTCVADTDCDDGTECLDLFGNDGVKECVIAATGTGRIGDPCAGRDDCGGGGIGVCIQANNWTERGYCSHRGCTVDSGCPTHSHCGYIDGKRTLTLFGRLHQMVAATMA